MKIPNILTLKEDQNSEYICTRWKYASVWESFICVYKKEKVKSFLLLDKIQYSIIGLELVNSHWGIQKATMGDWDFESKLLSHLESLNIYPSSIEVAKSEVKHSNICYDLEENQIFFGNLYNFTGYETIEKFKSNYPNLLLF